MSWEIWERAQAIGAVGFQVIQTLLQARMRPLVAALEPYDALITPALAQRPLPIGTLDTSAGIATFHRSAHFTPFTAIFNMTGQPAIALPLYDGPDGLPLGVQLAGRPAAEGELLALAAALERAAPPHTARPLVI
jgi:amidase